jgi:hypothetical protein
MGIGNVMLRIWKGQDRVIAYDSKTLFRLERNCCIVKTRKHFQNYISGQEFHLCITTLPRSDFSFLKTWKER